MNLHRFEFLAITLLLFGAGTAQTTAATSNIRQALLTEMAANAVPGLAVAMVKDGRVLFVEGYGSDGADTISTRTPFRIASLSKAFTAAAVLTLVEQGRIQLDAPVRTYLPTFTTADPAQSARITVRQLLNQTSGLADPGFPEMRLAQPHTLAERVETLKDAKPETAPGRDFHYFNPNYAVLARLVEVVSGEDYDSYLTRRILQPLGMGQTFSAATASEMERRAPKLAQGHVELFGVAWPWSEGRGFLGGSGGVVSTAEDLGRWLAMHANGGEFEGTRILSPDSVRLMQTAPQGSSYGMGWFRTTIAGRPALFHNGVLSTVYAEATLFRDERMGFVLLANVNSVPHALFGFPRLREILLRAMLTVPSAERTRTVRAFGVGAAVATALLATLCLIDLSRARHWASWAQRAARWKVGLSLTLRLVPLACLIMLPQLIEAATGRAFSFRATALAMLDIIVPLATCGALFALGAMIKALRLWKRRGAA